MFILRINYGPRILPSVRGGYNIPYIAPQLIHPHLCYGADSFIGQPSFPFGYHALPWGSYNCCYNPFTPVVCRPYYPINPLFNPFNPYVCGSNYFFNPLGYRTNDPFNPANLIAQQILANQAIGRGPLYIRPANQIAFA